VIAAADVDREGEAGVTLDDRVVELDARVEHLVRVAPSLAIAFANGVIQERGILRCIDLDVFAPESFQFRDLAAGEVDQVGEIGVAGRIRPG
jgi:hypothetical protein